MKESHVYREDWYRLKYSLAVALANQVERSREPSGEAVAEARRQTLELAQTCVATLEDLPERIALPWSPSARALNASQRVALRTFLKRAMEPAALTLLLGVWRIEMPTSIPKRNSYQASRKADHQRLATALSSEQPDFAFVSAFVLFTPTKTPRVAYNLACLAAVRNDAHNAVSQLETSLMLTPESERPRLAERALRDPTLRDFWDHPHTRALWGHLTNMSVSN